METEGFGLEMRDRAGVRTLPARSARRHGGRRTPSIIEDPLVRTPEPPCNRHSSGRKTVNRRCGVRGVIQWGRSGAGTLRTSAGTADLGKGGAGDHRFHCWPTGGVRGPHGEVLGRDDLLHGPRGVRFITLNASTHDARELLTPPNLPSAGRTCRCAGLRRRSPRRGVPPSPAAAVPPWAVPSRAGRRGRWSAARERSPAGGRSPRRAGAGPPRSGG